MTVYNNLKDAVKASGLKNGMTVSFHHHLRNGDHVMNTVLDAISDIGIRNIYVNASSVMDVHERIVHHINTGVVTGIETSYMCANVGRQISSGVLSTPVVFKSHGGRAADIISGKTHIDVAFVAVSAADREGNATGLIGRSAFGGIGYASADAEHASYVVLVTDNYINDRLLDSPSINGKYVDSIVVIDSIGDPSGIVSSTTQITRSPVRLKIAKDVVRAMKAAGCIKDGMNFQTGAGGTALAVAKYLYDELQTEGIRGESCIGGITEFMVRMQRAGLFEKIYDVQCFDRESVKSLAEDPDHIEITAEEYASPDIRSYVDALDAVILGATEIDLDFNVNVHTDSFGNIMGGSGGHSDAAQGSKLTIIAAPLFRGRISLIRDKVTAVSTPGKYVDMLVTEYGTAINPARKDLQGKLKASGVKIMSIEEQYAVALKLAGKPQPISFKDRIVGEIYFRTGKLIDVIRQC